MSITEDGGQVVITLRDIYLSQRDLAQQVATLSGRMETLIATNGATHVAQEGKFLDHDTRLRRVEDRVHQLELSQQKTVTAKAVWSAITVLGSLIGVAVAIIAVIVK